MSSTIQRSPFLRNQRNFPQEPQSLSVELNKSYVDIANNVNARTIGVYPTTYIVTGNTWYVRTDGLKQQSLRQVYTFTSTASINHGIADVTAGQFINCFGSYTDGTNSFGLIFGTSTAVPGIIQFYITNSQIVFVVGAGSPALSSGLINLEWLSSP